ncbi:LeuA family protein [Streptomyces sp. NBC_01478]|uniref:LeuA family protein n=1 Tax=Streptomyces sp. NBC_01478 TaxID=2903882 RepID=UPI002E32574F|nr:LeuA family protein [Streptomyces sp. NBC_01478]
MSETKNEHTTPTADVWFTWNNVAAEESAPEPGYSGILFDETLRDGLQAPHIRNPTLEQKLAIVNHMAGSGVRAADLGFPGSDPTAARECTELARHIAAEGLDLAPGYAGRTHPSDINAICEVGQRAGVAVEAYVFIGVSPIRQYVEDWDIELIRCAIRESAAECRRGNVEFVLVLEDAVRCTPQVLSSVYDVAVETGTRRLTLCDTVGAAVPGGAEALIRWTQRYFADRGHPVELEWHGHNDRGLALVNSLTALALGCARVHGTVLGIGERAGNASLDQLMINCHLDGRHTYDLSALRRYCEYAAPVLGVDIPQNYPALGRDVFKTSAGVHASAILKAHEKGSAELKDSVYAGVPAGLLGREQEVLIDMASGANNVKYWLTRHGYATDDATLIKKVLERAKAGRAPLTDEEIGQIIATAG